MKGLAPLFLGIFGTFAFSWVGLNMFSAKLLTLALIFVVLPMESVVHDNACGERGEDMDVKILTKIRETFEWQSSAQRHWQLRSWPKSRRGVVVGGARDKGWEGGSYAPYQGT